MNKHQELAIQALVDYVEHNQFHANLWRYKKMRQQDLCKKDGLASSTGNEIIALLEGDIADVDAAIAWIKAQDSSAQ